MVSELLTLSLSMKLLRNNKITLSYTNMDNKIKMELTNNKIKDILGQFTGHSK